MLIELKQNNVKRMPELSWSDSYVRRNVLTAIMISEILTPAVIFGGRLGEYKYYDMDEVIAQTLKICRKEWDSQD